ncbi:MAG: tRNA (adenosine(37)-N6)-threonylcarbamoyltransferase complex ATPase subunit type 1 TsaE [Armatimonadetes bacterium]|nr:tRNA (adenosine(37)-N6)-threonylcarbamoyltransferase complex ATPase subunit type 1 TsaE [Armatimonadota bacterium]
MMQWRADSADATQGMAAALAPLLFPGAMLALVGDLGAGKTTFAQGLCRALEVSESVASPTFVLLRVYRGRLPVYHFDAYRLDTPRELDDLGAEEYFWGDGVTLLEWADRVPDALPADLLRITFEIVSEDARHLNFEASGPKHAALLENYVAALGGRKPHG